MKLRKLVRHLLGTAAAVGGLAIANGAGPTPARAAAVAKPLKVYVSAGFIGNTWMDASLNLLRAIAKTKPYKDRITIQFQSARGDAQAQQQQINAMTAAGADIILAWPISPTALNRAIRAACAKGVTFMTWDADVTESCAYHVGIDQKWAGAGPAKWLAAALHGKGNIIFLGGIPGTLVDTQRNTAAKAVFAHYPGTKIIAETPSMWNSATAREKMSEIVAAQGWNKIDGVWTQTGCGQFVRMEIAAKINPLKPCAGNGTNGFRVSMLPKGSVPGAENAPGVSMGSPPWAAPYAFMLAVDIRDGKKVPKNTVIPMPLVTNRVVEGVKTQKIDMCKTSDRAELVSQHWACNAVPLSVAPADYFIDVWSPMVPALDLPSALHGTVPEGQ